MKGIGYPDRLEVINGPEDGTTFPIARTPIDVGADPSCSVHLRLDGAVRKIQARLTAVSDGYRVRALDREPVYVNGKRVGHIRSRVLRSQDTLTVGKTRLALICSNGGLAQRSHGLTTESDAWWLMRLCLRALWKVLQILLGIVPFLFTRSLRYAIPLLFLAGVASAFLPGVRAWALWLLWRLYGLFAELWFTFMS